MKISIIIPIYNEEKLIISVLKKIETLKVWEDKKCSYEIIIINDGSTDKSYEILEKNSDLFTKIINNKINKGKGFQLKKGF